MGRKCVRNMENVRCLLSVDNTADTARTHPWHTLRRFWWGAALGIDRQRPPSTVESEKHSKLQRQHYNRNYLQFADPAFRTQHLFRHHTHVPAAVEETVKSQSAISEGVLHSDFFSARRNRD